MIPADTLTRLKLTDALLTQPAQSGQKLSDALREFAPGQRLTAIIQTLLPNGLYRASVAQRDVTLSLPFAANAGEALELEVVEQNGKLTLAAATNREAGAAAEGEGKNASVATRLTVAGRLISELLGALDKEGGKRPQPAPLNNAQPVVNRFPDRAADLAPALKAALVKSGMFYEAHQAQWAAGKASLSALLTEPQGRFSPVAHTLANSPPGGSSGAAGAPTQTTGAATPTQTTGATPTQGVGASPAQTAGASPTAPGMQANIGSGASQQGAAAAPQASAAAVGVAQARVVGESVQRVSLGQVITP
ncbi:MAG: hypothetical protein LBD68_08980, partial [Zoogloeaceae bacterium]|nr:hypothetical protein [Zoogloeaceae bacterium]